ncbi:helix-turn-helix domain-containing protein [Kordiimonas sp. SCSIO 12610]|uniref:helix-turn-helix domain-containing protein n=1 Tax=Kordiimonas sp. SCSIO 12610 TaxID=2829597 RepID=UPI00210C3EFE|nr:helix-turn-helix transcriptional regulator [Kordiimonas sp. SCSIO 12610]UTW56550.1 helix-turn-helix transcriptional regulator [Kordiimonas sp. SCSIO 12610]
MPIISAETIKPDASTTLEHTGSVTSSFGRMLKQWRQHRGHSQLELSLRADVSQKHISFIETGRSRPKVETVRKVAEALEIPLREQNKLYEMAGLPARFPDVHYDAAALTPYRDAIFRMLKQQDPFPAYVVDRWWNLIEANEAGKMLFMAPGLDTPNMVDAFMAPGAFRDMVENFDEVAWAFMKRLRAEAMQAPGDEQMQALLSRAQAYLQNVPEPKTTDRHELALCPRIKMGDAVINMITMVAHFSEPNAAILDELRLELVFPADAEAAAFFTAMQV